MALYTIRIYDVQRMRYFRMKITERSTIGGLKRRLWVARRYRPSWQSIFFNDEALLDRRTFASYGVREGDVIMLWYGFV